MNDIFLTFFVICSFLFAHTYSKKSSVKNLLITSLFLGTSIATKWTGFYAIVIVFFFIFFQKFREKKLNLNILLLLVVPAIIYVASYGQFFLQKHSMRQFIDLHKQIWWYQNRRDLEHSYGTNALYCLPKGLDGPKTFCPWVLDIRGVYFSYQNYGDKAGYIYALGNPAIFWVGFIAVSYLVGKYIEERRKEQLLLLLGYFVFWLPWVFTPRILFLYHYLPSIPFLAVTLGVALADIYKTKFKLLSILIILIFAGAFFYLYPISSGLPIDVESISRYLLLKTWR